MQPKPLLLPLLLTAAALAQSTASQPATAPTPPPTQILGTIQSPQKITRIAAIDRAWADVLKTSQLNPKDDFLYEAAFTQKDQTAEFHIDKLLPGRSYDLIIWTTDATGQSTRWEGAAMDYHRPIIPSTPATPDDRKSIESLITDPPQFYDKIRLLHIAADHQHATALVELIRTRDFHSDAGGEIIYRAELWYFENLFGGWAKDSNTERVLARARGKPADIPANWQFLPQLGGLTPATQPQSLTLPDKPTPKNGLAGAIPQ